MIDALQVIRFSLIDFWDEFVMLVVLNILWSLAAALPAVPVFLLRGSNLLLMLVASILLALPLPIVTGGLFFFTNQLARGKAVGWAVFITGMRRYWAKSLLVTLINLVVLLLVMTNIQFYGIGLEGTWTFFATAIWLVLALYWLIVQIFWFPMILELESEKVLLGLRNALVMVIITPGFSITLTIITLILIVLCVLLTLPVVLIMASLLLLISNHATRSRLAFAQKKPYKPGAIED